MFRKILIYALFLLLPQILIAQTKDEIKSGFVLMFADNVEWENNYASDIKIGILEKGTNLYDAMQKSIAERQTHLKPIQLIKTTKLNQIYKLNILFIDQSYTIDFNLLNKLIKGKNILLITDNMAGKAMVNFEIINKSIRFEMDEEAISAEEMKISENLLGYYKKQATQNWQNLFSETQKQLKAERSKLSKLKNEITKLEKQTIEQKKTNQQLAFEIKNKEQETKSLTNKLDAQRNNIEEQETELKIQKSNLQVLYEKIEIQEQNLQSKIDSLSNFRNEVSELSNKAEMLRNNIKYLNAEQRTHLHEIEDQRSDLSEQEAKIQAQRLTIILSIIFIIVVTILSIITFKAFRNKKKANKLLEKKNIAILEQKEEIESQKEKIQEANQKLIELDRFKEGMTGMIVHDLKNPLNGIINISKSQAPKEQLKKVRQFSKQMLNMVLNILDVQKYDETKMEVDQKNHSLLNISINSIEEVGFLAEQKEIIINNSIKPGIGVKVDVDIIDRVFVNLLTNAIKYTPNNGNIDISCNKEINDFVKINVCDTGPGIPQEMLHKVFDKFEQVAAKKSGNIRSTGLGLTFCKIAVEAHKGKIGVKSQPGQGTTFWFTLPIGEAKEEVLTHTISTDTVKKITTASFIDSEIATLKPILIKLKAYEVYELTNVEKIIAKLETGESESLKKWKKEMENTMYAMNEEKYNELVNIIPHHE